MRRVAHTQWEAESLMANSARGMSDCLLSCRSETKERSDHPVDLLRARVGAVVVQRPEDERGAQFCVKWGPELRGEAGVPVTDAASELAVSSILKHPVDCGAYHTVAYHSLKLAQLERAYPPHLLEPAVVSAKADDA